MKKNSLTFYSVQMPIRKFLSKSTPGKINTNRENQDSSTQYKLDMSGTSTIRLTTTWTTLLLKPFKAINSTSFTLT